MISTKHETYLNDSEREILENIRKKMFDADNIDSINKLYRQGRTWARHICYYVSEPNVPKYREIVEELKQSKRYSKKALFIEVE